jgi:hypothetical protein
MITRSVVPSNDLKGAQDRFMDAVREWIEECLDRYTGTPATDVHDQATFTTSWTPYLATHSDARVMAFLKETRDSIHAHFAATDQWQHGYWRQQEAHHGTEHFELFLGMLHRLDPTDETTRAAFLDAAEHILHEVAAIPPWVDGATGLFRSMFLGTAVVRTDPGMELNIPDHLRFVNLCLLAHEMGGGSRYLNFAETYTRKWARAILERESIPMGLLPDGPIYELGGASESAYRSFAGMAGHLDDDVDRAENLLASNGTGALLALWKATGDVDFLQASERLLDVLSSQLQDPDAGAAADALRSYRRMTGNTRYDEMLNAAYEAAAGAVDPFGIRELGIEPEVLRGQRPHGIGKRTDMPGWFEDGRPRRHTPILLSTVAEIRQDEGLAVRALDLARTAFELARATLPDGRAHGCAANTVSAIARGHGRENGAGMVTAVLGTRIWATHNSLV